jgi:hypothetical protein
MALRLANYYSRLKLADMVFNPEVIKVRMLQMASVLIS